MPNAQRILHDLYAAAYKMTDPGSGNTIYVDRQLVEVPVVTAGAEARTLAQPTKAGLLCAVVLKTRVGNLTLTVTGGYNQGGDTSITYDTQGDWILFRSTDVNGSYYWRVIASEGTTLAGGENALTGVTAGTVTASKAIVVDASKGATGLGKLQFTGAGTTVGAEAANAVIAGVGTSGSPCIATTAGASFLEFRTKTTATSGDCRGLYLRHEGGGVNAAGSIDCLRAFTSLSAAVGNAHGGHISLNTSATGYVTGQGVGMRGQLYVTGITPANGTYYGAQAEMYFDASATIAAAAKHAILSVQAAGDPTAKATCLNAIAFDGTSAANATKMISSVSLAELPSGSVGIAVLVNGTRYYIPAVVATEWN